MCGVCGLFDNDLSWHESVESSKPLRQTKQHQMVLMNQVLAPYRLKISDFYSLWILAGPTGQQVIIKTIDQIWIEAEKIIGFRPDPLNPDFLAKLTME